MRLRSLERHIELLDRQRLEGAIVECGVAEGGSAALLAMHSKGRPLFLFDTFEGLPPPTPNDPDFAEAVVFTGANRGEEDQVRRLLSRLAPRSRYQTVKGLFQDTVPITETGPIALLHLDGDWYDSIRVCLEHLYPRVVPGGIVQLDDYGYWAGCKKAVDDYFGSELPSLHLIVRSGAWFRKPVTGTADENPPS